MPKTIQDFINDYNRWLEGEENRMFTRDEGSCFALLSWSFENNLEPDQMDFCLKDLFHKDGLRSAIPFNPSLSDYYDEVNSQTIDQNPRRIAWYKAHAK